MLLRQGRAVATGRRSPHALYDPHLATYGAGDAFRHGAAAGFIEIFGLPLRTACGVAAARPAGVPVAP